MSIARTAFIERTEALQSILSDPVSIDNRLPARPNSPAALIRNGCMVMLFTALESFVRDRAIEVLTLLDRATVPYGALPEAIKLACVVNTFDGLLFTTKYMPLTDRIQEFERIIPMASAGLVGHNYQFSEYAFGKDKSNLSKEDIKIFAQALGISDPWARIRRTASRLGALLPSNADIEFKNLATNRHRAAHRAGFVIDH